MVLTDQNGLPLSGIIDSAQKAEVNLALETIDAVSVPIRPQHDKKRPEKLVADKAYDAKWLRDEIKRRSIQPSIPKRRKKGQSEEPKYNQTIKGEFQSPDGDFVYSDGVDCSFIQAPRFRFNPLTGISSILTSRLRPT